MTGIKIKINVIVITIALMLGFGRVILIVESAPDESGRIGTTRDTPLRENRTKCSIAHTALVCCDGVEPLGLQREQDKSDECRR